MSNANSAQAANDLLNGGGGPPAFKFETKGDTAKGRITELATAQARDFVSGEPKFYTDGNPIMQIVITLQPDNDDEFRLFVKPQMKQAIREAVQAVQATQLEVGGILAVRWDDEEPPTKKGFDPKKLFTAQYKSPVAAIPSGDLI
jgi:hypothetical protein